jgi:hypothetical protein
MPHPGESAFTWTPEDAAGLRREIVSTVELLKRFATTTEDLAERAELLASATGWLPGTRLYGFRSPEPQDVDRVWDQDGRPWTRRVDQEVDSAGHRVEVTRWTRQHRVFGTWRTLPLTMHETWRRGPLWRGIVAEVPPIDLHKPTDPR